MYHIYRLWWNNKIDRETEVYTPTAAKAAKAYQELLVLPAKKRGALIIEYRSYAIANTVLWPSKTLLRHLKNEQKLREKYDARVVKK